MSIPDLVLHAVQKHGCEVLSIEEGVGSAPLVELRVMQRTRFVQLSVVSGLTDKKRHIQVINGTGQVVAGAEATAEHPSVLWLELKIDDPPSAWEERALKETGAARLERYRERVRAALDDHPKQLAEARRHVLERMTFHVQDALSHEEALALYEQLLLHPPANEGG